MQERRPSAAGFFGAVLYGAAFTYFAYTTLVALHERIPTYEVPWQRLGGIYTVHGAMMILGGILFSWSALQARWLPRYSILLFLIGLTVNLILSQMPGPAILQTIGSAVRDLGLVAIGYFLLFGHFGTRRDESPQHS